MNLDFSEEDIIDFDPVRVKSIRSENGDLIINMPGQPCYSQRQEWENGVDQIPMYEVEFLLKNGANVLDTLKTPFETQEWKIKTKSGSRTCFLPALYLAEEPISLTFKNKAEILELAGMKLQLKIIKLNGNSFNLPIT